MVDSIFPFSLSNGSVLLSPRPSWKIIRSLCKSSQCDTIITLLWETETPEELNQHCTKIGADWVWFPIKAINYTVISDPDKFQEISNKLLHIKTLLDDSKKILIHCAAGVHRTGFVSYVLSRLCGKTHQETLQIFQISRPAILEKISQLRLEIAEDFFEKLQNHTERYVPFVSGLDMVQTDWIKPALKPLLWVKVLFFQDVAKVSFCVTCANFQKIVVGSEVFLENFEKFGWSMERRYNGEGGRVRNGEECAEIIKGLVCSSTVPKTVRMAGMSCFFDKEFFLRHMPQVLDVIHYRIVDLASFEEIRGKGVRQSQNIYEDIEIAKNLKEELIKGGGRKK